MTKKQMQARITELETLVASLNAAVAALSTMQHPIYVGPIPAQPTVNPLPINPFPMPYIGDPPYPWGPTTIGTATGISGNIGGLQAQCNMGHQEG
jgi:hypothetical protein